MITFTGLRKGTYKKINPNNKEFYKNHPDLAPRDIYLSMGRTINIKKVNRTIENFEEPFLIRAKNWCKNKFQDIF